MDEGKKLSETFPDPTILFNDIYLRYGKMMYALAYRLTANKDNAEDLVQETFMRAIKSFSELQNHSSFLPWLKSILFNAFRDNLKKKKESSINTSLSEPAEITTPYDILKKKEEQMVIRNLINSLPERDRVVLGLSHLQGFSDTEIARILEVTVNHVRVWLHRARTNLQERLRLINK